MSEDFDLEKYRSVGNIAGYKPGAKKAKPVVNENDGSIGGHHVEHYDGSVDAHVTPRTVNSKTDVRRAL